ncbi:MAG: glycosyltransferase [Rhodobacteraceae bacterium]|nr:glycosyltransferase [Paracoccaceae bacterium]
MQPDFKQYWRTVSSVPAHNEPPEVLIATLASLAGQRDAPPHEIIVVDNNTADADRWQPVAAWCRGRAAFRFLHREGVSGAKAGALTIALAETRADATHVVIVDADYVVAPDFLARAADALGEWDADFLQFPQAYRAENRAAGTALELSDYFRRHARTASGADAMLLTGTLSVISAAALRTVGGWRADTVTEDAELGVRLCRHGFRGRYVERRLGQGLLPFDLPSLHRQRYRWTAGNVRTLLLGLSGLGMRQGALVVSQLTAWANLALIFAAVLAGAGLRLAAAPGYGPAQALAEVAVAGLAVAYAATLGPLAVAALRDRAPAATLVEALATRIALLPTSAIATLDALLGARPGFAVTAKDASGSSGLPMPVLAWAGVALVLAALATAPSVLLGAALMLLPLPAGLWIDRRLRCYGRSLGPIGEPA